MNKKFLVPLAILLAVAAAAYVLIRRAPRSADQLKVSGTIEVTSVELSFKVGGRLNRRLVDEGQMISAGQLLANLEDNQLREERSARSADQRAARAMLADLQAGSRREEIRQGEAVLDRMRAEADRLARDAVRMEKLYQREVIPLKELEAVRAGRNASAAAVREAEERVKLLRIGPRPDAVQERRARVEAADAGLSLAETRLADSILTAPQAGLVLAKHAEPGEMLAPGSPVLTLGLMDQVWLRAYIPEGDLGRVLVGQKARVTVDSWPGRSFEGRISFISPQAEFTPKNVQTEKERVKLVYRIKITLANPRMELKPGMPADAVIETGNQSP